MTPNQDNVNSISDERLRDFAGDDSPVYDESMPLALADEFRDMARELLSRRASDKPSEAVAYMRRWAYDGIDVMKITKAERPSGWILHAVTENKCLADDVPLYTHPEALTLPTERDGVTEEMVERALAARPRNSTVAYFLNPNNNLTDEGVRELMRAALTAALTASIEGKRE